MAAALENRARFGLEVLRAVKAAAGAARRDLRFSVEDYFPQGMPCAEGRQVAIWAAEAGADALHVAAGPLPLAAVGRDADSADGISRRHLARLCGGREERRRRAGDRGRAARRSGGRGGGGRGGKADFIALGRTSVAEPAWVEKLARGETARRCLACNTCINEMRGGARIGCVVNGMAGRELAFAAAGRRDGERIAVIGAGPAGLTYAALVAEGNAVTVFERDAGAGGAFRYAGKAPLFQEVEAAPQSFARYRGPARRRVRREGVTFRYGVDVARAPELLAGFDRIVIATGARYRLGMGPAARALLDAGAGRWPGLRQAFLVAAVSRLVLLPRPRSDGRALSPAGAAGPGGHRHRRRAPRRQEQGRDRERVRRRLWGWNGGGSVGSAPDKEKLQTGPHPERSIACDGRRSARSRRMHRLPT